MQKDDPDYQATIGWLEDIAAQADPKPEGEQNPELKQHQPNPDGEPSPSPRIVFWGTVVILIVLAVIAYGALRIFN